RAPLVDGGEALETRLDAPAHVLVEGLLLGGQLLGREKGQAHGVAPSLEGFGSEGGVSPPSGQGAPCPSRAPSRAGNPPDRPPSENEKTPPTLGKWGLPFPRRAPLSARSSKRAGKATRNLKKL